MNNTAALGKTRTRKVKGFFSSISRADKERIDQKKLDDLESDVLEGFISSNESISEFEGDEEQEVKKNPVIPKKNRKIKKLKKDKRATLTKSKVNLKQMLYDMEKKNQLANCRGINYLSVVVPNTDKPCPVPLCSVCLEPSSYSCTRCMDRFCDEGCYRNHKELICAHLEYNYYI